MYFYMYIYYIYIHTFLSFSCILFLSPSLYIYEDVRAHVGQVWLAWPRGTPLCAVVRSRCKNRDATWIVLVQLGVVDLVNSAPMPWSTKCFGVAAPLSWSAFLGNAATLSLSYENDAATLVSAQANDTRPWNSSPKDSGILLLSFSIS